MIQIPPDRLDVEVLRALIREYVLREGTDYGAVEASLESKIAQLEKQIHAGTVLVTFDEQQETCNLMTRAQFAEATAASATANGA